MTTLPPGLTPAEGNALYQYLRTPEGQAYLRDNGLGAYPEYPRSESDLTTPADIQYQALGVTAESADPSRVQPQMLRADTTTTPDLTRVFPTFITAQGGFRGLSIDLAGGAFAAPLIGLRRLVYVEPGQFNGQGLIIGSIRAEMLSTDSLGGGGIAWGDANGLGAGIVAGFNLAVNDDDRMYPANVEFPGAGLATAPAIANSRQLSWATTFPPGSAFSALGAAQGQKATIGEDWPPFVQRIVEGQAFSINFALNATQATAADGDSIAGYVWVRMRLALLNTIGTFNQGFTR